MTVDGRADFYSLGAVFYHLLKGKPLFSEYVTGDTVSHETALEVATAHRSQFPNPPTGGKQPLLDALVLQLLQKIPDLRYRTAKGLIHDLREIESGRAEDNPSFVLGEVDKAAKFTFPQRNLPHPSPHPFSLLTLSPLRNVRARV